MKSIRLFCSLALTLALLSLASPAAALKVELSAEASVPAKNDIIRATVFAEADAPSATEVAARVNSALGAALARAKRHPNVKSQSGAVRTHPVVNKAGKIERWRMSAEILLESRDQRALGELLGELQAQSIIGVRSLSFEPSAETARSAHATAYVAAIEALKADARVIAEALGKRYRITRLAFASGRPIVPFAARGGVMAAEAAPLPVDPGESRITVNVSGQIELFED